MYPTVAYHISEAIAARKRCQESGNHEWAIQWTETLRTIERECLPSGAGIDTGTKIDEDRTNDSRIVLTASYHHMNVWGYYNGWTDHVITVRPTFDDISVKVSGRNRDGIKDYLAEEYHYALSRRVDIDPRTLAVNYEEGPR